MKKTLLFFFLGLLGFSFAANSCNSPLLDPDINLWALPHYDSPHDFVFSDSAICGLVLNKTCCAPADLNKFSETKWLYVKMNMYNYITMYEKRVEEMMVAYDYYEESYANLMLQISDLMRKNWTQTGLYQREINGKVVNLALLFGKNRGEVTHNRTRYHSLAHNYRQLAFECAETLLNHWGSLVCLSCLPDYETVFHYQSSKLKMFLNWENCQQMIQSKCYDLAQILKVIQEEVPRILYIMTHYGDSAPDIEMAFNIGYVWFNNQLPYGNGQFFNLNCTSRYCGDICSYLHATGFSNHVLGRIEIITLTWWTEFSILITTFKGVFEAGYKGILDASEEFWYSFYLGEAMVSNSTSNDNDKDENSSSDYSDGSSTNGNDGNGGGTSNPSNPSDSSDPSEPSDPSDPSSPSDSSSPSSPSSPSDPSSPSSPSSPSDPASPSDPSRVLLEDKGRRLAEDEEIEGAIDEVLLVEYGGLFGFENITRVTRYFQKSATFNTFSLPHGFSVNFGDDESTADLTFKIGSLVLSMVVLVNFLM